MSLTSTLRPYPTTALFLCGLFVGICLIVIADYLDAQRMEQARQEAEVTASTIVRLDSTPTGSPSDTTEINMDAALHAYADAVSTSCEKSAVYTWAIRPEEVNRLYFSQYSMTCSGDGHWGPVTRIKPLEAK